MGPLRTRFAIRRQRRYGGALLAVLAISAAIAAHHMTPSMGMMHHNEGLAPAVELCLGVLTAVGAAVVAIGIGLFAPRMLRAPVRAPAPARRFTSSVPLPRARAGPTFLCVMRC